MCLDRTLRPWHTPAPPTVTTLARSPVPPARLAAPAIPAAPLLRQATLTGSNTVLVGVGGLGGNGVTNEGAGADPMDFVLPKNSGATAPAAATATLPLAPLLVLLGAY